MDYCPIWCKSHFSFLEGASSPDQLIKTASAKGLKSIALTDRDGLYGVVRAHVSAKERGIKLLIGSELTLDTGQKILMLARNHEGYAHLCKLISIARLQNTKGKPSIPFKRVLEKPNGISVICLPNFFYHSQNPKLGRPREKLGELKDVYGKNVFALIERHKESGEKKLESQIVQITNHIKVPTLAGTEVLYHADSQKRLQDVLTCIRKNVSLTSAGSLLKQNSSHSIKSNDEMNNLFQDCPERLVRTLDLAQSCTFSLEEIKYRYPSETLPDGTSSFQRLRRLSLEGLREKYPQGASSDALSQLHKELKLIEELDYCGYFLTMHEIVEYCQAHNILCQGRGSAANSIVCYLLGITAIDPIKIGLLFERFISRERKEPPDIDLDIEHNRREEVIQHVYKKYGRDHAAMVSNVVRYRLKSSVQEIGKALGIEQTALTHLSKLLSHQQSLNPSLLYEVGLDPQSLVSKNLIELSNQLLDTPRHLSIHPGGFLLGKEPINHIVPIENATMHGRTVIQWDKHDVEDLGLFKVDLLGLGALTHIHLAFDLLKKHQNLNLSLASIPDKDKKTFSLISKGDTVGIFQIESRAQMSMLPRLRPKNFYDLVIEISIVRPGPITGGMVHPYLRRRNDEEEVTYPHPLLEPVLKKTLGIPLFQEQVMRLAVVAADYTPGEADQLRRAMAAWQRSGKMEEHRDRLITRMKKKGIEQEFAERVFEQIKGFGEYGFPESHAASFALIAYATAYLKAHHLAEFTCALLNAQPIGFYSPDTIIHDAKRHGLHVLPISIIHSHWNCILEKIDSSKRGYAVRMGFRYVKGLTKQEAQNIENARPDGFASVEHIIQKCGISENALNTLSESGAFSDLDMNRRQALWDIPSIVKTRKDTLTIIRHSNNQQLPPLSSVEKVVWDYQSTNHSTRGHLLKTLRSLLRQQNLLTALELNQKPNGYAASFVGLVICRQRPGTASGVTFYTLEDESGLVNVVVWPNIFDKHTTVAKTAVLLGVHGEIQSKDSVVHLVANRLWSPKNLVKSAPRSRDFH